MNGVKKTQRYKIETRERYIVKKKKKIGLV